MADEKKAFIMYMDWARIIANIPEEQAGEIIKAVCCKELGIDYEISDPVAAGIFISIAHKLDDDDRSYKEKCDKNRTIAKEREKKKHERLTDEHERSTNVHERLTDEYERSTNEHERSTNVQ